MYVYSMLKQRVRHSKAFRHFVNDYYEEDIHYAKKILYLWDKTCYFNIKINI